MDMDAIDSRGDSGEGRSVARQPARLPVAQLTRQRIGEVMVLLGLIDPEQAEAAAREQAASGRPFGECCVALGLIQPAELQRALACQFGFPPPATGTPARELALLHDPFGPYAEGVRLLCTRLRSRLLESGCRVLAITSAGPREGRSYLAANLGIAFAQAGWRTLLIDADLRSPRQHELFGVPQHPGLSRLLCGQTAGAVRLEPAGIQHLTLIPSGPPPPNPLHLLGRNTLAALLRQAVEHRELVLLDTPAASLYADPELIAGAAGGALVLAAGNRSRVSDLRALLNRLAATRTQVIGTVLNAG